MSCQRFGGCGECSNRYAGRARARRAGTSRCAAADLPIFLQRKLRLGRRTGARFTEGRNRRILHTNAKSLVGVSLRVIYYLRKRHRETSMSVEQFIQGIIGGLAIGCIYSLIALGITMIIRATEILHFAQGEIMMIGAMTGLVRPVDGRSAVRGCAGDRNDRRRRGRHGDRAFSLSNAALVAGAAHQYCRFDIGRFAHPAERGAPGLGIGAAALPYPVREARHRRRRLCDLTAAHLDRRARVRR